MEVLKKEPHIHKNTAALVLENGEILWGYGLGEKKAAVGELCFNTSQTGYQEALSDPSYTKQIITFTFPHVGIVGTCLLYTSPSPRDLSTSRMPSSA